MDNGLEDLWRRENPDSSEFTHYDRFSGTRSNANNTKINQIMVYFTDHYTTTWKRLMVPS